MVEVGYEEEAEACEFMLGGGSRRQTGRSKIVVTISINQKRKNITLENWGCDAVAAELKVTYSIQMQQEEGQDIDISDGIPVVISFEKLLARPAKDGEGDAETWVVQFEGPSYF